MRIAPVEHEARLLAPVEPATIRDFSVFEQHIEGAIKTGGHPDAAVITRAGRNVRPEDAGAYIGGYTIFNDWSAGDIGGEEVQTPFGQGSTP
jgi:2-keto-4-pentenoate hydratase/2-oxohepta-3-ene-1,7-dioic acid hydratase in catechol pathway